MINNLTRTTAILAVGLLSLPHVALAGCRSVAGTIDATVIGGDPVTVLGNVTGDLSGATRAIVTNQSAGDDGSVKLGLEHSFVTFNRSSLTTADNAVWTPVPGKAGVFHMSTEYDIKGGTGAFAEASGKLINDGIADTNTGLVTLRYEGEICMD